MAKEIFSCFWKTEISLERLETLPEDGFLTHTTLTVTEEYEIDIYMVPEPVQKAKIVVTEMYPNKKTEELIFILDFWKKKMKFFLEQFQMVIVEHIMLVNVSKQ